MSRKLLCMVCLLAFVSALAVQGAKPDRLTLDALLDWEYVAGPQISPDGANIIYTRRWTDKINDRFESELWIMNADGSRNRFLTKGGNAVWSPDGKRIAYVTAGQPAGAQIFTRWMDTGDTSQLTHIERGASSLEWSPDGKQIAFNMLVPAKSNALRINLPPRPEGAKWTEAPKVIDRLNYRADGAGYNPEGFSHIFTIPDTGGTPRQLTDGDYNHAAPNFTPDGSQIIFSAVRKPEAEYLRGGSEIYALNVKTGAIKALTDRDGTDAGPAVSRDGRFIAYTGNDNNNNTYNITRLYVMNLDGTNKRELTGNLDRDPTGLVWANDNGGIYFTAEDKGTNQLYLAALNGPAPKPLTSGNQQLLTANVSNNGRAVAVLSAPQEPGDVVTFTLDNPSALRKLTDVNGDVLAGRKLGTVEEIWYDSVGGMKVQGWVVKPPDFDPAKKYPLILYIHGGPHSMYGVGMNFEFQQHAAEGYVVLYTNPRGSTGYGQAFGNAIKNNYPGQDYDDLMSGVDTVSKKGYIDERNLFVCGGSGGGVLTTWIVGHTNRFAAAVAMKPVINWYSFVGTTDSSSWYYNFAKLPWDDPSEHLRRSPITYVGNVKTPTMLMTGELDLRTPMEETEQYYRALKLRKVDTLMVRVADEYHPYNANPPQLRHPSSRLYQILYLRGWFEKYRKK